MVEDSNVFEAYAERAQRVVDRAASLVGQLPSLTDRDAIAKVLLTEGIFSPASRGGDEDLRIAFESCLRPECRLELMSEGISAQIGLMIRAQFQAAATRGELVAEAMVKMLDVLTLEAGGRVHMAMDDDKPAILWADILRAVDARQVNQAEDLLTEFIDEEHAVWIGDQPYLLVDSLLFTVPRVVTGLSRRPREKRAIFQAGHRVFSAALRSYPEKAFELLIPLAKAEVEEHGLGVVQEAETEARYALGPEGQPSKPVLKVTRGDDGEIKVERI
ncbi:MAG TPA: hypothetical protein VD969_04800 [Symbiobacteriaceae bacterium]|nr:hypothetical protein [Symbiobacteriaceae bacterium]